MKTAFLRSLILVLFLPVALQGCLGLDKITADERSTMIEQLGAGRVIFDCDFGCAHRYIFNQEKIWGYYNAGQSEELALAVMKAGWRQDITYFFLGIASEQLGYLQAADRYYRLAGALSTGQFVSQQCASVSSLCGPFVFPRDVIVRLRAVDAAIEVAKRNQQSNPLNQIIASATQAAQARTAQAAAQGASAAYVYNKSQNGAVASATVVAKEMEICRQFSADAAGGEAGSMRCRDANGDWYVK